MKINWEQTEKAYTERFDHLTLSSKVKAMKGMQELREAIKIRFPEAADNPLLLIKTDRMEVISRVRGREEKNKRSKVSNECIFALKRVRNLLLLMDSRYSEIERIDPTVKLTRLQALHCFGDWLKSKGWKDVQYSIYKRNEPEMTAYNGQQKMIGMSPETRYPLDYACKNILASCLFRLMDAKNSEPDVQLAMPVAFDEKNNAGILSYSTYLLKAGIRIFIVKSEKEVEELLLPPNLQNREVGKKKKLAHESL